MDRTQKNVQRDVQTIREICSITYGRFHPLTTHQAAIEAWVQKTKACCYSPPMPWQILLDDEGTLDLKIATELYISQRAPFYKQTRLKGTFLRHVCVAGKNITEASIILEDNVSYPLHCYMGLEINEKLNIPLMTLSHIRFCFNKDAHIDVLETTGLDVYPNVYEGMIENTYEQPIFFGPDKSLCIFKGHVRYAKDVCS